MCSKGFLRRMLPFFATFAIGIFIASFFVSLSGPRLGMGDRGRRYQEFQRMRFENEDLKNENLRLRNELENRQSSWSGFHHDGLPAMRNVGPEVPVEAPMPPAPPMAPRVRR
ncbi:hypothetical protein BH10ACI2_BH10ACI2_20920 [soil metagenome]